jgi:hypothetical protein
MPRAQVPGPVGLDFRWHAFDRGTWALAPHAAPGPVGLGPMGTASAPPQPSASAAVSSAPKTPAIDIDAAVAKIEEIALTNYSGKCATHVRLALEAGGANMATRPALAKNYGPKLLEIGFAEVAISGYTPQKGDVAVFDSYATQSPQAGHIQMYSGTQWISDTRQPRFLAHRVHYVGVAYAIYRP